MTTADTASRGQRRYSVAVVQGGPASEAEVSRASAASVARGLEEAGHRVVRLELDHRPDSDAHRGERILERMELAE